MANHRSDIVDLEVEYVHHTEKGLLVSDGTREPIWLPLGLVECDLKEVRRGECFEISLPGRLAKERGLI